jgi:integrase
MRKRRGNNEGSIYEVADRGWVANVSLGNGKRKALSGKTRAEVARKVNTLLENQRRGIVTAPARLTVAAYLNSWLRDTVEAKGSPNT